jgi:hypothetical protein
MENRNGKNALSGDHYMANDQMEGVLHAIDLDGFKIYYS